MTWGTPMAKAPYGITSITSRRDQLVLPDVANGLWDLGMGQVTLGKRQWLVNVSNA